MKTLWSNKRTLPIEWSPARSLSLALPSLKGSLLSAETKVGYEKVDLESYMDGVHKRNVHLVILGFGLVFKTEWNSDGRFK